MQSGRVGRFFYSLTMVDEQRVKIQEILSALEETLDRRLMEECALHLPHVIVAIEPNGHALVQGNVDLERLRILAKELAELVDATLAIRKDDPEFPGSVANTNGATLKH